MSSRILTFIYSVLSNLLLISFSDMFLFKMFSTLKFSFGYFSDLLFHFILCYTFLYILERMTHNYMHFESFVYYIFSFTSGSIFKDWFFSFRLGVSLFFYFMCLLRNAGHFICMLGFAIIFKSTALFQKASELLEGKSDAMKPCFKFFLGRLE